MNQKRDQAKTDELLSAYIDGELKPGTRIQLENRLEREPELHRQLEALQETVALVKSLPQVEAPRHFLITPAMVEDATPRRESSKQRTSSTLYRWLAPVLSFATAVSALLLVITMASSFLGGQYVADELAASVEATQAVGVAEIPESAPLPEGDEGTPPEALLTAPTDEPSDTPLAMQAEETPVEGGVAESEPAPTETPSSNGEIAPTSEPGGGGGVPPTEEPSGGGGATPEPPVADEEEYGTAPSPSPLPEERAVEIASPTATALPVAEAPEEEAPAPIPPAQEPSQTRIEPARWIMPAGLGLLTLILAVATALAWRADRIR